MSSGETTRTSTARATAVLVALLGVYLVLLAWVVLWKLEVPWVGSGADRHLKLLPFVAAEGAGASNPVEVALNVVLFVPVGLYLGLLAPSWRWWRATGVVAAASLVLEVTQYVLAVGRADVSDVIANTTGGLVGVGLVALARRSRGARGTRVVARVCALVTVLAVLAAGAVVASPLRFGGPGGGACPRQAGADRPGSRARCGTQPVRPPASRHQAHSDSGSSTTSVSSSPALAASSWVS
jgi:glycopeptide antibiotics resistance protein